MKITRETRIRDFRFYGGAADRTRYLESEDWDVIEPILEKEFKNGIEGGDLNNYFWFGFGAVATMLGYKSEDHFFSCKMWAGAFDEREMKERTGQVFPNCNKEAIAKWVKDEWNCEEPITNSYDKFIQWYHERYASCEESWLNATYVESVDDLDDMRAFISGKDLNEKTIEEWLDEYILQKENRNC